ncbi:MAG TPA: hypothetical protein VNQ53_15505 [Nocardioides sp.]|nr:hypothetical protein [Nocardioides sp.]
MRFDGAEYKLVEGEPDVGVGGVAGQAHIPECSTLGISDPDAAGYDGAVFPATAYTVMEIDPAEDISMNINGDVRVLRRTSAEPATDADARDGAGSAAPLDCSSSFRQAMGLAPLEGLVYFPDLGSVSRYYFGDTQRPIVEVDPDYVVITDTETAPQVRLIVERDDEGWGVKTMEACADATLPPLGGVR